MTEVHAESGRVIRNNRDSFQCLQNVDCQQVQIALLQHKNVLIRHYYDDRLIESFTRWRRSAFHEVSEHVALRVNFLAVSVQNPIQLIKLLFVDVAEVTEVIEGALLGQSHYGRAAHECGATSHGPLVEHAVVDGAAISLRLPLFRDHSAYFARDIRRTRASNRYNSHGRGDPGVAYVIVTWDIKHRLCLVERACMLHDASEGGRSLLYLDYATLLVARVHRLRMVFFLGALQPVL